MITLTPDVRERLDKLLARLLPEFSRTRLAKWIEQGHVRVNGEVALPRTMVELDHVIEMDPMEPLPAHDLTPSDLPIRIVYEDDDFLIVDKPRGLATHPAHSLHEPSLVNALLGLGTELSEGAAAFRPGIVHRLDKETTGVIAVAKTEAAHVKLARQIERKEALRLYLAIVRGEFAHEQFIIAAPIARDPKDRQKMAVHNAGRRAVTHVQILRHVDAGTLVMCRLETGRTHQIRVHLRSVACPVVGDPLYAPKDMQTAPLQLHAAALRLRQPTTDEVLTFVAVPPTDFLAEVTDDEIRALADSVAFES